MNKRQKRYAAVMAFVIALAAGLSACQPPLQQHPAGGGSGGSPTNQGAAEGQGSESKRKLTVVEGAVKQEHQAVSVQRIHRLEGANIETWVSDDALKIMTTTPVKAGTAQKEPEFVYTTSVVDLSSGDKREESAPIQPEDLTVTKEQVSPDGRYSFIQDWADKYTARNYMKNQETGVVQEIKLPNYMELGGWLDPDSYILAAGDQAGRGDLWQIGTDGTAAKLELEDPDVELFTEFGVSRGSIYYLDNQGRLKTFKPGQSRPETVSKQVGQFEVSPDGAHIAVQAYGTDRSSSELRLLGPDGREEGGALAKGNLIPYLAWSPDSSKLALAVYNEDQNGLNGVYIFDYESGLLSLVGPGYFPQYPLSWSPSGKRLGITIAGEDSLPVTQIMDLNL
ncbi:hypothetical protein AWM70_16045 [Paenibacillus yonginensis]|uniref:Lipoprotein LpqB beta-propeller domain-containing protein n=1 Tax=Paenibacillus yonginensis TaxID=1462996 RepID=A0A1B1N3B0_9BACL|nr:WD40 repeat domain-containing protein [Paenibacillus yonginensis]ANS75910.1 hypothetical protein AWM70_16045 [Paenibacillus yonginensis]